MSDKPMNVSNFSGMHGGGGRRCVLDGSRGMCCTLGSSVTRLFELMIPISDWSDSPASTGVVAQHATTTAATAAARRSSHERLPGCMFVEDSTPRSTIMDVRFSR